MGTQNEWYPNATSEPSRLQVRKIKISKIFEKKVNGWKKFHLNFNMFSIFYGPSSLQILFA
jgi:hypothetical protein